MIDRYATLSKISMLSHSRQDVDSIENSNETAVSTIGIDIRTPLRRCFEEHRSKKMIKEYFQSEVTLKSLEQRCHLRSRYERAVQIQEGRGELFKLIHDFFPSVKVAHMQQAGLYILIDRLLKKEELRSSVREGRMLAPKLMKNIGYTDRMHADPQKLLQMINRLLRDGKRVSQHVTVKCHSASCEPSFVVNIVQAAENVLRHRLSHHPSVQEAATDFLSSFSRLRAFLMDHLETSYEGICSGKSQQSCQELLKGVEKDDELRYAYQFLDAKWHRFTHLFFKERAYHLIQMDMAEIHALMETTSRLSA